MHGKEKVNRKKKRLFGTSFIQIYREKPSLSILHSEKNYRSLVFAALADVVLTKQSK
jgi:hypothetical protein